MKLVKMARFATVTALLSASLLSAYSNYKAKESYNKMRSGMNDLKNRIFDLRTVINSLTRQLKAQNASICDADGSNMGINQSDAQPQDNKIETHYTVKDHNGMVGVYNEENLLVDEKSIVIASLPASDRQDLSIGIKVNSDKELDKLLDELGCIKYGNQ